MEHFVHFTGTHQRSPRVDPFEERCARKLKYRQKSEQVGGEPRRQSNFRCHSYSRYDSALMSGIHMQSLKITKFRCNIGIECKMLLPIATRVMGKVGRFPSMAWNGATCHPVMDCLATDFRRCQHKKRYSRRVSCKSTLGYGDSQWYIWSCISLLAALSHVVSNRTHLGKVVSSPLVATLFGLIAVSLKVLPQHAPQYDIIWSFITPFAASLYLLESDVSKLFTTSRKMVIAFLNGAVGTVIGTWIAFIAVGGFLGPDGAKVAAALCASYIGGSINFAAVSRLVGLTSGGELAATMAADNFCMALYIAVLTAFPTSRKPIGTGEIDDQELETTDTTGYNEETHITVESVALSLAGGLIACFLGDTLSKWSGFSSGNLAFAAIIASLLSFLISKLSFALKKMKMISSDLGFRGSELLGGSIITFLFIVIGATAGGFQALLASGYVMMFISIQLSIQLLFALFMGHVMNIDTRTTLIAANANAGGPATAAAMAASKGWRPLIQPALLAGTFGYAVANWVGWLMYTFMAK